MVLVVWCQATREERFGGRGGTNFKIYVYDALSIKKSDYSGRQDDLMLHS
jgi:hypothetical protein